MVYFNRNQCWVEINNCMFHKTLVMIQIMKVSPAQLSPLLRTDTQGFILAQLFMNPEDGFSISELARFAGVSTPTAMREVDRLVESHMVTERTFGRARLIQVNTKHLLYEPTRQIVVNSYGPVAVLPAALYGVDGLEKAYIYGDWAARLKRELGPEPNRVELLIVGYVNRIEAARAAANVERYLGRDVNVQFVSTSEWEKAETEFVKSVKAKALVELDLN